MDIFHFILIALVLILSYLLFNADRKNQAYEKLVLNYDEMIEGVKAYMKLALNKLISLDRRQVFEGDDEVGFFFSRLKEEYVNLNNNIASVMNETTEESDIGVKEETS